MCQIPSITDHISMRKKGYSLKSIHRMHYGNFEDFMRGSSERCRACALLMGAQLLCSRSAFNRGTLRGRAH